MKKKIISVLLSCTMAATLAGCAGVAAPAGGATIESVEETE